jgi:hypothetical protein
LLGGEPAPGSYHRRQLLDGLAKEVLEVSRGEVSQLGLWHLIDGATDTSLRCLRENRRRLFPSVGRQSPHVACQSGIGRGAK